MKTKKPNVIRWRNGWITPRQSNAIKRIEDHTDFDFFYEGETVRDASAFITNYQKCAKEDEEYDNMNDSGYEDHGQWQDGD